MHRVYMLGVARKSSIFLVYQYERKDGSSRYIDEIKKIDKKSSCV